jgi:indolepyruvate ferredoxin oxidoreductase beta subunit
MKKNILIAGVGGQGILTIAAIIDHAAMQQGLFLKQAEVHGMSQRGGAVQSHLRISDTEIFSDLIPLGEADLIISLEPMEALRYLPYLSADGTLITATKPFINIDNYPPVEVLLDEIKLHCRQSLLVDADRLALEAGNPRAVNVVMVGAAAHHIGIGQQQLETSLKSLFEAKGPAITESNARAFALGLTLTMNH